MNENETKNTIEELTQFLNIDFELSSVEDIASLARDLGNCVTEIRNDWQKGSNNVAFEIFEENNDPNIMIECFFKAISTATSSGKAIINNCTRRVVSVGIQAGMKPRTFSLMLNQDSLDLIQGNNFKLEICIYGADYTGFQVRMVVD